jgi:hypothetical protein
MILFGFGVGVLVGLTGTGGGSVMTPLLVVVFGIKPATAIGTDIAYAAVTKTLGGWRQLRAGRVDTTLSTRMAFGSVPGAIIGTLLLGVLERRLGPDLDTVVFSLLGGALLLTGTALLARIFVLPRIAEAERESADLGRRERIGATVLGAFVGLVLGLTSAGSGALIAVGLIMFFRLVPDRVIGTDVFHAAIVLWAAAIAHVFSGDIDYGLAATLLIGSLPGIWIGTSLSLRAPVGTLRTALAAVLLAAGLGMLTKAGVDIPTPLLAAGPVIVIGLMLAGVSRRKSSSDGAIEGTFARLDDGPVPEPEPERVPVGV